LKNGFRACGLYPFNIDALDFSKILNKNKLNNTFQVTNIKYEELLLYLEKEIELDTLQEFKKQQSDTWHGKSEDTSLFKIWHKISNKVNNITINLKSTNAAQSIDCIEASTSSSQIELCSNLLQKNAAATNMDVRKETIAYNSDDLVTHIKPSSSQVPEKNLSLFDQNKWQIIDLNTISIIDEHGNVISDEIFDKEESKNVSNYNVDIFNKNTSLIQSKPLNNITESLNTDQKFNEDGKLRAIPTFQDTLFWPKKTFQKKEIENISFKKRKRQTETIPAVITSDEWKKYKLEKELQKIKKEEEKEIKKQIRLQKQKLKQKKDEEKKKNKIIKKPRTAKKIATES